jgi:invasion protein IalB
MLGLACTNLSVGTIESKKFAPGHWPEKPRHLGLKIAGSVWCLLAMALACGARPALAQVPSYLATPAVNPNLFQKGVVRHERHTFGTWTLVCDAVAALHQRFCSLLSTATDQEARTSIGMIVSTSDNGRPAAILRLPVSAAFDEPVTVSVPDSSRKTHRRPRESTRRLGIVACGPEACTTVWALSPAEVRALTTGDTLTFRFDMPAQSTGVAAPGAATDINPARLAALIQAYGKTRRVTVALSGRGFNEAIKASQSQH